MSFSSLTIFIMYFDSLIMLNNYVQNHSCLNVKAAIYFRVFLSSCIDVSRFSLKSTEQSSSIEPLIFLGTPNRLCTPIIRPTIVSVILLLFEVRYGFYDRL